MAYVWKDPPGTHSTGHECRVGKGERLDRVKPWAKAIDDQHNDVGNRDDDKVQNIVPQNLVTNHRIPDVVLPKLDDRKEKDHSVIYNRRCEGEGIPSWNRMQLTIRPKWRRGSLTCTELRTNGYLSKDISGRIIGDSEPVPSRRPSIDITLPRMQL